MTSRPPYLRLHGRAATGEDGRHRSVSQTESDAEGVKVIDAGEQNSHSAFWNVPTKQRDRLALIGRLLQQ